MASSIEALPPELLEMIGDACIEIDGECRFSTSLLQLRSTSRVIQAATRRTWLVRHFNDRCVALTPTKLTELAMITQRSEFACTVVKIDVIAEGDNKLLSSMEDDLDHTAKMVQFGSLLGFAFRRLRSLREIGFIPRRPTADVITSDHNPPIDFSVTLSSVLLAIQTCGLRPTSIDTNRPGFRKSNFAITACSAMSVLGECFSELADLHLSLNMWSSSNAELTKQLVKGLNRVERLECLDLRISHQLESARLFSELARSVHLPNLDTIILVNLVCNVSDLACFLCNHSSTLERIAFRYPIAVDKGAMRDYRDLLTKLRRSTTLIWFSLDTIEDDSDLPFSIPEELRLIVKEEPNEDGFIEIDLQHDLRFDGATQVQEGLSQLLSCMVHPE